MKKNVLMSMLFVAVVTLQSVAQTKDPVILNIAGEDITKSEFERVFHKNNNKDTASDQKAVDDYLQLFINYKLKVREALDLGMDTVQSFKNELAGYRKQLAQPYLVDKDVTESLLREAYNRMKTDVRASHILIKCDPNALPKDTVEAYNKAMKIRGEVVKGGDFAALAKRSSDDPSAKDNGGDLGYFTALQMVYPFETAVYSMKAGDVSAPVRTRFGYHVIKLTESRPAQGEVKVAHIMVKTPANASKEDSINAVKKINEIHGKLKSGEKFDDLVKQYSDDQTSSKNGGVLPMFGTGRMVPEFEKAAFALKNQGDYTDPVKTSYGWHIIKLMEARPLAKYEELLPDLKQRVQRDSRSELSRTTFIDRVKSKNNFKEYPKAKDAFMKSIDTTLSKGRWNADKAAGMNDNLFSLGSKNYSQQDFAKYIAEHQTKKETDLSPVIMANSMYVDFQNESIVSYEESHLDSLYPDFRNLMQEYRDGILLFELTDKKVWSKAVKDTTGLKAFYDKNKTNYMWPERLDATVYNCANAEVAAEVRKLMKKIDDDDTLMARINKTSQLNLQVKSGKFARKENDVVDKIEWKPGTSPDVTVNNQVAFVKVRKVLAPMPKSIDEAKGIITADYQNQLEKEWIDSLRAKYPVKINQEVVNTVAKK